MHASAASRNFVILLQSRRKSAGACRLHAALHPFDLGSPVIGVAPHVFGIEPNVLAAKAAEHLAVLANNTFILGYGQPGVDGHASSRLPVRLRRGAGGGEGSMSEASDRLYTPGWGLLLWPMAGVSH